MAPRLERGTAVAGRGCVQRLTVENWLRERIPSRCHSCLNLIYAAALVIFSPLLFYRWLRSGKYREGWVEKLLGKAPLRIGEEPCLWFHAVSVGEVLLLRPLVQEMARAGQTGRW